VPTSEQNGHLNTYFHFSRYSEVLLMKTYWHSFRDSGWSHD